MTGKPTLALQSRVVLHSSKYGILSGNMRQVQCAAAKLHCTSRVAVRAAMTDLSCFKECPKTAQAIQSNLNIMSMDTINYQI